MNDVVTTVLIFGCFFLGPIIAVDVLLFLLWWRETRSVKEALLSVYYLWRFIFSDEERKHPRCPVRLVDKDGVGYWRCPYLLRKGACPKHGKVMNMGEGTLSPGASTPSKAQDVFVPSSQVDAPNNRGEDCLVSSQKT
jgi:hypothetical protein